MTDEWLENVVRPYNRIVNLTQPFKRKEILSHATTLINPEDITLCEISSHKRTNTVWLHLAEVPGVVKNRRDIKQNGSS